MSLKAIEEYVGGASIPTVAAAHGLPRSRVRQMLLSAGVLRTRTEGVRLAAAEGRTSRTGPRRPHSEATRAAIGAAAKARGDLHAAGESLKAKGYVEITRGANKGKLKHRLVAEEMIGRPLAPNEVVHHKDRNRANNEPSNLQVMTRSAHTRLHRMEGY